MQISVSFLLSYCGSVAKPMRKTVILSAELWVNGLQERECKATLNNKNKTKYLISSSQMNTTHIRALSETGPMETRDGGLV